MLIPLAHLPRPPPLTASAIFRPRAPRLLASLSLATPPPPLLAASAFASLPLRALLSESQREVEMVGESEGRPLRVGLVCGGPSPERGISLNSARSVLDHIQGEDLLVTCYYIDCGMNAYAISPAQVPPSLFDCYLPRVYVLHVVSAALASISFAGICVLFIIFILVDVAPDYCHTTLLTYSVCCIPRTSSFTILSSTFYSRLLLMFYFYCFITVQLYSNTPSDFDFKLESLAQGFQSLFDFAQHLAANVDIVFPVIHGKFGEDGGIQELLEKANVPFVGTPSKNCLLAFDKVCYALLISFLIFTLLFSLLSFHNNMLDRLK
jgi:D-alanine-D-alanine ligase-like ATP-grasp enzyme